MKKSLHQNDKFISDIFKKYLLSSIFAVLSTSASGFIDTIIIGSTLGKTGLAAMSLISPVYLVYYTIGALVGVGASIIGNICVGRNEYEKYSRIYSSAFWITAIASVILTAIGLLFLEPIALLLGADATILPYVKDYLFYYIIGGAGTLFIYIPLNFLKVEGRPRVSSAIFMLSSFLNVVLTIILVEVFDMGMAGASIGTAIAMTISAIVGFILLHTKTENLKITFTKPNFKEIGEYIYAGTPNALTNLFNAAKIFGLNLIIIWLGFRSYLSVFTVVRNIWDIYNSIMLGIATAILPIIGVFFGELDNKNVRRVFGLGFKYGIIIVAALSIALIIYPYYVSILFSVTDDTLIKETNIAVRLVATGFVFGFINCLVSWYCSAIKKSSFANLIIFMRLILFLIPTAMGIGKIWGLNGVWISFLGAEVLTLATTCIVLYIYVKHHKNLDKFLLDKAYESSAEISFSVENKPEAVANAAESISDFCDENGLPPDKSMQLGLIIEEITLAIIEYCLDNSKQQTVDVRVRVFTNNEGNKETMVKFRNGGKLFNILKYYNDNKDNEEMQLNLLGTKIVVETAKLIDYRETFGANNLLIMF